MSITLTYPIRETYENLALKKDRTVVACGGDLTQTKSRGDGERLGL